LQTERVIGFSNLELFREDRFPLRLRSAAAANRQVRPIQVSELESYGFGTVEGKWKKIVKALLSSDDAAIVDPKWSGVRPKENGAIKDELR
jgi:hypothetical protein